MIGGLKVHPLFFFCESNRISNKIMHCVEKKMCVCVCERDREGERMTDRQEKYKEKKQGLIFNVKPIIHLCTLSNVYL